MKSRMKFLFSKSSVYKALVAVDRAGLSGFSIHARAEAATSGDDDDDNVVVGAEDVLLDSTTTPPSCGGVVAVLLLLLLRAVLLSLCSGDLGRLPPPPAAAAARAGDGAFRTAAKGGEDDVVVGLFGDGEVVVVVRVADVEVREAGDEDAVVVVVVVVRVLGDDVVREVVVPVVNRESGDATILGSKEQMSLRGEEVSPVELGGDGLRRELRSGDATSLSDSYSLGSSLE